MNGAYFDKLVLENVKGVSQDDIYYFSNNPETIGALVAGKVDAIINDSPLAQLAVNKNDGIGLLPDYIVDDSYGYVLEKDSDLTPKMNERLKAYREDGTLDRLKEKWASSDESKRTMPDMPKDGTNGTIVVATSVDNDPINYLKDDRMHGMCIELLEMIARDLGYGIEYRTTNGGSLIAEIQSGKADIAANSFSITDERKKMVDMTEPYYEGGVAVIVRTVGGSQAEQGVLGGARRQLRTNLHHGRPLEAHTRRPGGHVADIGGLGSGGASAGLPVRAGPPQERRRRRRQAHPRP